jgi:hypothetical protein
MKMIYTTAALCVIAASALASGCAYTLKYSVAASVKPQESPARDALGARTFTSLSALKGGKARRKTETQILYILAESLEKNGWTPLPEGESAFTFTVSFKREETAIHPEIAFRASPGWGSGLSIGTIYDTRGTESEWRIGITAFSNEQPYRWTAEIKTKTAATNLIVFAQTAIPGVVALFPDPGYWEIEKRVTPD